MSNPTGFPPSISPAERYARAARQRELVIFCRQLGTMLKSGTEILRALTIAEDQLTEPAIRSSIENARQNMSMGWTLAMALGKFPQLFSPFFLDMVRQGEGEGTLGDALHNLADYLEKEYRLDSEVGPPELGTALKGLTDRTGTVRAEEHGDANAAILFRLMTWVGCGAVGASIAGAATASFVSAAAGAGCAGAVLGLTLAAWGQSEAGRQKRAMAEAREDATGAAEPQIRPDDPFPIAPAPITAPPDWIEPETRPVPNNFPLEANRNRKQGRNTAADTPSASALSQSALSQSAESGRDGSADHPSTPARNRRPGRDSRSMPL